MWETYKATKVFGCFKSFMHVNRIMIKNLECFFMDEIHIRIPDFSLRRNCLYSA